MRLCSWDIGTEVSSWEIHPLQDCLAGTRATGKKRLLPAPTENREMGRSALASPILWTPSSLPKAHPMGWTQWDTGWRELGSSSCLQRPATLCRTEQVKVTVSQWESPRLAHLASRSQPGCAARSHCLHLWETGWHLLGEFRCWNQD